MCDARNSKAILELSSPLTGGSKLYLPSFSTSIFPYTKDQFWTVQSSKLVLAGRLCNRTEGNGRVGDCTILDVASILSSPGVPSIFFPSDTEKHTPGRRCLHTQKHLTQTVLLSSAGLWLKPY